MPTRFKQGFTMTQQDQRRSAPSALRNRETIANILQSVLPDSGVVLEIGSGTGEHVIHFAEKFSNLTFQPTERDPVKLESIIAWTEETKLPNIRHPFAFDLLEDDAPIEKADAVISANVIHIAPWAATVALFKLAGQLLPSDAPLFFYGPFHRSDIETAPSNVAFDAKLHAENPGGGLRHIDDMTALGEENGFSPPMIIEMPANNLSVIFKKI
ncbi:MAG: DUF938 domain-containing protein [Hyphomicrobiales bacterium]